MELSREELDESICHIVPRKPYPQYIDDAVFLDLKGLLQQHPDKVFSVWAYENPRLFLLLRMLGCDDDSLYQRLDSENIGDFWLPLGSATLNQLSSFTNVSSQEWRRVQHHVLSKSEQMSEQKLLSPIRNHRHIQYGNAHFEEVEKIGKGGSAEVARVKHTLSAAEFACKRIRRAPEVKIQRRQLIEFVAEVNVLKRVNHDHLVSLVASYTDLSSFSLILNPVAKDVLKSMLERQARDQPLPPADISTLRRSFGCLATALAYLHKEGIRHKDIKPGNILLSDGRVYLCDFGISRDLSRAEHSTTDDEVLKLTPRYCAPEVFGREPRNKRSDVWSLGCVFLEIISVVKGYSMDEMNHFLLNASEQESNRGLWCALDAMIAWLEKIRSDKNDSADDLPLGWITAMIRSERDHRINASELVELITKASSELEERPDLYICSRCTRNDSVIPTDAVESPKPQTPQFNDLGILDVPTSPTGDRGRGNVSSLGHHRYSKERSISPRTQNFSPSDSTQPVFLFPTNSGQSPSRDLSTSQPSQRGDSQSEKQRSSSLFSPTRPESESMSLTKFGSRSPVPPPASIPVKCNCAARAQEKHIFNETYTPNSESIPFDPDVPTIEECAKCETGKDRVQVYESLQNRPGSNNNSAMPMLWWTTRRLVISYSSGQPKMRHCCAFWLPLADIQVKQDENVVTLQWSDCNQMVERIGGNYSTQFNWIYDPTRVNNSVSIGFNNSNDARKFRDIVRLPYEDGETISNGRRVKVSGNTELNIFDIGRPGVRNYRAATLTVEKDEMASSKLYIQWPEADLDIHIRDSFYDRSIAGPGCEMIVKMDNMTTPTYQSDIRGEPAEDRERVAYFNQARQLKTSLVVAFQIGLNHSLPTPPEGVKNMLQGLTGWTLCFFATLTKFKSKNKRFGSKKYGSATVMLWEKEMEDDATGIKRRGSKITFRLRGADFLWACGDLTDSSSISTHNHCEATISVANKTRGQLLDVTKMVAIASETAKSPDAGNSRGTSDFHNDLSELVLTFENEQYRLEFVNLATRFKVAAAAAAAAAAELYHTATSDSMHRMSSFTSNDIRMSHSMR